jgi:hypothetical protein
MRDANLMQKGQNNADFTKLKRVIFSDSKHGQTLV